MILNIFDPHVFSNSQPFIRFYFICSIILLRLFVAFERFVVLATKIPYYVAYDIDFVMIILRLSRATVLLLTLISKCQITDIKRYKKNWILFRA